MGSFIKYKLNKFVIPIIPTNTGNLTVDIYSIAKFRQRPGIRRVYSIYREELVLDM